MASSVIKKQTTVKNVRIAGTTDSAGNIELTGIDPSTYIIVSITTTAGGYPIGVYVYNGKAYAKIVNSTNPLTPSVNTSTTLFVAYI